MAASAKSRAIANSLAGAFKLRLSLAVAESFDTDQNPLIKLGSGSIGAAGALIKVKPQDWPEAKDILGLAANIYSPDIIQIVMESNPAGGAGADINSMAVLLPILAQCAIYGCKMEVYLSANGNAPDASDIVSGNLAASFQPSAEHGMIANQ